MSWAIGYDKNWKRDIGYGVPAFCDHPGCTKEIHRGLDYVCGGEPYGGAFGCGLYFCYEHRFPVLCERCSKNEVRAGRKPRLREFAPTADHPDWVHHKLTDESWQEWRENNPNEVSNLLEINSVNSVNSVP